MDEPRVEDADDERVDLVVAGAGGGLVAALRAAELGLSVLVVDRSEHFALGNNTSMSTAMIPGAGSRWQRAAGVADDAGRFLDDVRRKTGGSADPRVAATLAGVSARLVEWLADHAGLDLDLVTDFDYPGHSVWRCHTVPDRSGRTMLAALLAAVRRRPEIDLMAPAELVDVEHDGRLRGVTLRTPHGTESVPARALLLATNGFAGDPDLVRRHLPEMAGALYHGSEGSTGDALRLGGALGAAVAQLDAYQGHAAVAMPGATLAGWATVMHGGFLVDRAGARFGDETTGYSEYASVVLDRAGGEAWIVVDRRIHEACLAFRDYQETVATGAVRWGDSPAELAERTGIDPQGLAATVAETGLVARGERPDRFGRTHWEAPLAGALAAISVRPALFHTQGGLSIDEHARVLRPDGSPVAGVYAAGGAAVGMSGAGAGGYLAGNGLLAALGLSLLAAEHAAGTAGEGGADPD